MAKKKAHSRKKQKGVPPADSYGSLSQQPLQILFFLLPLLVLYELAALIVIRMGYTIPLRTVRIIRDIFGESNISSLILPALLIVVVLLVMHAYRRDRWRVEPKMYGMMWIESVVLAMPIIVFAMLLLRETASAAALTTSASQGPWIRNVVMGVGAGIYEELLFRLIGIALIHLIVVDLLKRPDYVGEFTDIYTTAILVALLHFGEHNPVTGRKFAYYTLAGVYLACIYIYRGFGIVVGTHAMYNVFAFTLAEIG